MKTKSVVVAALAVLFIPAALLTAQTGTNLLPKYGVPADTSAPPPDFVPVEKEPTIIRQAVPKYPELAQTADVEGYVVVKVWVGKNGIPRQAIVLRFNVNAKDSSSQPVKGKGGTVFILNHGVKVPITIFKQPAVDAAMKYRFTPAIENGKPVAVWVVIPFTFKLKPNSAEGEVATRREVSYIHTSPSQWAASSRDTSIPPPDFVPVEKEPQILRQAVPPYPPSALKDHTEGQVILKIWVSPTGMPRQAIILKSTDDIFNQPAIDAAMKYRFTPAIMNKMPVSVWVVIPFSFKLKPENAGPPENSRNIKSASVQTVPAHGNYDSRRYSALISYYNDGLYHERRGEYREAAEDYRSFLKAAREFGLKAGEMERHANEIIKKYSKTRIEQK